VGPFLGFFLFLITKTQFWPTLRIDYLTLFCSAPLIVGIVLCVIGWKTKGGQFTFVGISLVCVGLIVHPAAISWLTRDRWVEGSINADNIGALVERKLNSEKVDHDTCVKNNASTQPAPWTPVVSCCEQSERGKCSLEKNRLAWQSPEWKSIGFEPEYDFRFQYKIEYTCRVVTIQVRRDYYCDGEYSLYELRLIRGADGTWVTQRPGTRKTIAAN
jgi:hypothetical protein